MERERLLQRAQSLLSSLRREIEVARNMGKGDIFTIAEDVVRPILGVVYGLSDLENLNVSEHLNYPAVDLGDSEGRVAFQVTSQVTTNKIESTLDTFFDQGLHSHYNQLVFIALYRKQTRYPQERINGHVQATFDFDLDRDVIDLGDLERKIAGVDTPELSQIVQLLSDEITEGYVINPRISDKPKGEHLLTNLIEIDVPNFIYVADLAIDREKLIEKTWEIEKVRDLQKRASWTQVIKSALRLDEEPPVNDFLVHGGSLLTFHDLRNADERLSGLVLRESVKRTRSEEFVGKNDDHRRRFSYLLDRCFSQLVHHLRIKFHVGEKQYFFLPGGDESEPRKESWTSNQRSRKVYDPTIDEEGELWYAKHLSFNTWFIRIRDQWYLSITPDWYWSFNGYFSTYSKIGEKRDWIKNREYNNSVRNHFQFIHEYIKREVRSIISNRRLNSYAFLSIGDRQTVGPAPSLNDELWHRRREREKADTDDEINLFTQSP